jgi:thioredoxin-related protein
LPNIVDKGDHTLVDFPGYLDRRRYNAVVGVSYVLKGAF